MNSLWAKDHHTPFRSFCTISNKRNGLYRAEQQISHASQPNTSVLLYDIEQRNLEVIPDHALLLLVPRNPAVNRAVPPGAAARSVRRSFGILVLT